MTRNKSIATWFLTSAATIGAGYILDLMMKQGRVPGGSLKDLGLRVVDTLYRNREFLTGPTRAAVEVANKVRNAAESHTNT